MLVLSKSQNVSNVCDVLVHVKFVGEIKHELKPFLRVQKQGSHYIPHELGLDGGHMDR